MVKKVASSEKSSLPEDMPVSQPIIGNSKPSKAVTIGIITGIIIILGVGGFAVYKLLKRDTPNSTLGDNSQVITDCSDFLIDSPPDDILTKIIINDQEKQFLQQEILCAQSNIESNNQAETAYTNLGEASRRLGDLTNARQYYEKALQLNPGLQEAKLGLALVEQNSGNAVAATKAIQEALALNENSLAYLYEGIISYRQKDFQGAETAFRKAIDEDSNNAYAHYNLGLLLERQGKKDDATAEYQQTIKLNPNLAGANYKLGFILYKQGEIIGALVNYQQAINQNISSPEALNNIGIAMAEEGNLAEAILQFQAASKLEPNNSYIYYNLGLALFSQGNSDDALIAYRKSIQLNPNLAEAHAGLGDVLRQSGKLDQAITQYRKALKIKPNLVEVHEDFGLALEDKGDLLKANSEYQKSINLSPDNLQSHWRLPYILYRPNKRN